MSKKSEALEMVKALGLHVETWAPGDGSTRYRVFQDTRGYHSGGEIYTALGPADLLTFLKGWRAGFHYWTK